MSKRTGKIGYMALRAYIDNRKRELDEEDLTEYGIDWSVWSKDEWLAWYLYRNKRLPAGERHPDYMFYKYADEIGMNPFDDEYFDEYHAYISAITTRVRLYGIRMAIEEGVGCRTRSDNMNGNREYRGMIAIDQVDEESIPKYNYQTQSYGHEVYVYGRAEPQGGLTYGRFLSILAKMGADMDAIKEHDDERAHGLQKAELYAYSWLNNRDVLQLAEWLRARDVPYVYVHLCEYSELSRVYIPVPDAPLDPPVGGNDSPSRSGCAQVDDLSRINRF